MWTTASIWWEPAPHSRRPCFDDAQSCASWRPAGRRSASPGEALFFVPPLSLPDPRRLPAVDGLLSYEAAGLSNLYTEGLELAAETGDRANAAYCPEGLATLIAARDEPERATRLFGASEALLEAVGAPLYAHAQDRAIYDSAVEELRSRLGEGVFEAVWAEGRTMSPERAIGYALETPEPPEESEATPEYPAGLSAPRSRY